MFALLNLFSISKFVVNIQKLFVLSKCVRASKFVLHFKFCSQYPKNVRALRNCSRFQICCMFQKLFSRFKKKISCFEKKSVLPSLFSVSNFVLVIKIISVSLKMFMLKFCSQISSLTNLFSDSKFVLKIKKMFVL